MLLSYEQGPIRPPSEAFSLLLRLTRNCPWNRCLFCPVYKGQKYSRRSLEEIKQDIYAIAAGIEAVQNLSREKGCSSITREIVVQCGESAPELYSLALWLYRGAGAVFLQDGDNLSLPTALLGEVLLLLRQVIPGISRITTYARSRSLASKTVDELVQLKQAGLSRIHVGLESGCNTILGFMKKGASREQHLEAGHKVKEAGISLSEYVLLGLGGREHWRKHALETAAVLNEIRPDFIRLRTLAIHPASPLYQMWGQGQFEPLDEETILLEEKLLLENLEAAGSTIVSDHFYNLLEDVSGRLPEDRPAMIARIEQYLALPPRRRELFRLGRRTGIFRTLDDLDNPVLEERVAHLYRRLEEQGLTVDAFIRQAMAGSL